MPSGTGKSTTSKKLNARGYNIVDIDDVRHADPDWDDAFEARLKQGRRDAISTGSWDAYSKVYEPALDKALLMYVEKHGPIDVLLNHGPSIAEKHGVEWKAVVRGTVDHLSDLLERQRKRDDSPEEIITSMKVGMTNLESVLALKPVLAKNYNELEKFIESNAKKGEL